MIVPMKKVACVVIDRDREEALEKLRKAGVLHLEKKVVSSDALSGLLSSQEQLRKAAGLLRRYPVAKNPVTAANSPTVEETVRRTLDLGDEKKQLQDQLSAYARERRVAESWGDFDPRDLDWLASQGVKLVPYELSRKAYDAVGDDVRLIVLRSDKRGVKALALAEIPGQPPFVLPQQSLSQIDEQMANIRSRLEKIETGLAGLACHRDKIDAALKDLQSKMEFETAKAGMETLEEVPAEKTVSWLSGYVPDDRRLGLLKRAATENGWALAWEDPAPGDKPPTLVRSSAVVRIIHPLFSFLGTVPGYREYDISASYLVFFCLFFAMIFGDAAYGLLLFTGSLAVGLAFKGKGGPTGKFPDAAKLFMLLSACTVAWGAITGSWFAIPSEKLPRFMQALIVPPFNNAGELAAFPPLLREVFNLPEAVPVGELKTRWNIQFLCFSVGAIQLVWARGKNIMKALPSLTALSQAGWLLMMIGLYFLVLFMLLKVPLPPFATFLIGGGLAMYFIFAEQHGGNFFKNIAKSFTNFLAIFLNAVGSFADIISYIRLFAVGLAGSIIAQSFNAMAIPADGFGTFGVGFILRLIAAILILVFSHSLNLAMNALSVIVHGVRLNLLEYAGNHLGMEWSGYAYKPFAERQKK